MNKITDKLFKEASDHVAEFLRENLSEEIIFHTFDHSRYVADRAEYIGRQSGLSDDDINTVRTCALFHDVGYAIDPENHEEESAKMATEFLAEKGIDAEVVSRVSNAILSTSIPQQPKDLVSRVLCDADMFHLSEEDYFERIEKLRKEMSYFHGRKINKANFDSMSLIFFKSHQYHTDFARKELQPKKEENMQSIKQRLTMKEPGKQDKKSEKADKKTISYSRGVESMFRLTARNQINLSSIADNKSNILISVNTIIMSIAMTVLVTRFEEVPHIIIPTIIFLLFSLITIVFAILSTRPHISSGTFSKEDIELNKVNLIFFGNFYNMKLDEYEWAIGKLMKNDENLYRTMIKDQHALGKVLAKKYKLLRVAYNVFMVGIIISVLAFVLAFMNF